MAEITTQTGFTCGGCDVTWTGFNRCHCAACHQTYNNPSLFDRHRRDVRGVGTCQLPTAGMRCIGGIWCGPASNRDWYEAAS